MSEQDTLAIPPEGLQPGLILRPTEEPFREEPFTTFVIALVVLNLIWAITIVTIVIAT